MIQEFLNVQTEDCFEELENVNFLYSCSYNNLSEVFYSQFIGSNIFNQMVIVMNQNMIEYRFLTQAGLLKD